MRRKKGGAGCDVWEELRMNSAITRSIEAGPILICSIYLHLFASKIERWRFSQRDWILPNKSWIWRQRVGAYFQRRRDLWRRWWSIPSSILYLPQNHHQLVLPPSPSSISISCTLSCSCKSGIIVGLGFYDELCLGCLQSKNSIEFMASFSICLWFCTNWLGVFILLFPANPIALLNIAARSF